jgi:hypothetical protein
MKSKTFFSLFAALAGVPLLLAYLILELNWFTPAATNKGEFLPKEVSVDLKLEKPTWSIVYQPQKNDCDQQCEELLYGLNQTYIALGKLQKRVNAWVMAENFDISDFPAAQLNKTTNPELSNDYIYIVDPRGKVILRYAGTTNREETIKTSKDILSDLKKLLNYARIG